ncbi:MFS general substrate transporter [Mycena polygramma]|nr:MFS general substrate transporter [Mycena polygramma]
MHTSSMLDAESPHVQSRATTPDTLGSPHSTSQLPKLQLASEASPVPSPQAFPEGGLQAWCTVAGAWIGSINAFIIISGGLFAGRLYDRGHFHILLCGGCLLQCFSLFMLSLCKREQLYQVRSTPSVALAVPLTQNDQIFLAQGLGQGIGAGLVYIPSIAVVSHYFQKRRALAMTIVASGSSLGAVVHPILLNNMFHRLGFANAVRASAGLVSGLLLMACLLMRPRLPPATAHPPFWRSLPRFARDLPYVFAILAMCTYTTGFYFPLYYLQLDAITHGINQTLSFYSLVILNASSFVGRLSPGFFVHRLGVINMGAVAAGVGSVLILSMIALKSIASVVVIAIIYGYSAGIYSPGVTLMAPLFTVLTDDLGELGLRMGIGFGFVGIGGLIDVPGLKFLFPLGPPINGALLGADFIWWQPALFSGLMASVGCGFFVATLIAFKRKQKTAAALLSLEKTEPQSEVEEKAKTV